MKIKVFEILGVWLVKSKSGYAIPLIEFYEFKAKKGNNFISKYHFSFLVDGGFK